jgi:hypothetical protein
MLIKFLNKNNFSNLSTKKISFHKLILTLIFLLLLGGFILYTNSKNTIYDINNYIDLVTDNDWTLAINKCIEDASSSKGTIILEQGKTYNIGKDSPIVLKNNIKIDGNDCILNCLESYTDVLGNDASTIMLSTSQCNNITIKDFTINGNVSKRKDNSILSGINIGGSNNIIKNIKILDCGVNRTYHSSEGSGVGIGLSSDEDAFNSCFNTIENCTIDDSLGQLSFGIRVTSDWTMHSNINDYKNRVSYNNIENNTIYGTTWNAIEIAGCTTTNNVINNNKTINNLGNTCIEADKGASYNIYSNNFVENFIGSKGSIMYAYRCQGWTSDEVSILAKGNIFKNCYVDNVYREDSNGGLLIISSDDCTVTNCNFRNVAGFDVNSDSVGSSGITIDTASKNIKISGCSFNNVTDGIYLMGQCENVSISNSDFHTIRHGILGSYENISELNISNNMFYTGHKAIFLKQGQKININNNSFMQCLTGDSAINIILNVNFISIADNIFYNNTNVYNIDASITSSNCRIVDNVFFNKLTGVKVKNKAIYQSGNKSIYN